VVGWGGGGRSHPDLKVDLKGKEMSTALEEAVGLKRMYSGRKHNRGGRKISKKKKGGGIKEIVYPFVGKGQRERTLEDNMEIKTPGNWEINGL